jgi:hypothetical protein
MCNKKLSDGRFREPVICRGSRVLYRGEKGGRKRYSVCVCKSCQRQPRLQPTKCFKKCLKEVVCDEFPSNL